MNPTESFPYTLDPERIPTAKVVDVMADPGSPAAARVQYACPDPLWRQHFAEWQKQLEAGNRSAPMPMPFRHVLFENPTMAGRIFYGDTSKANRLEAVECGVRNMLEAWSGRISPDLLEKIVKATVDGKMRGEEVVVPAFMACMLAAA